MQTNGDIAVVRDDADIESPAAMVCVAREGPAVASLVAARVAPGARRRYRNLGAVPDIGDRVRGTVVGFNKAGAAVLDIGRRLTAILDAEEFSWLEPTVDLTKRLAMGHTLEAEVIAIWRKKKLGWSIHVSHRETIPNPWETIENEHTPFERVWAKVTAIDDGHALVELETGYAARMELGKLKLSATQLNVRDVLRAGAWVEVIIDYVNGSKKDIRVKYRAEQSDPWATAADEFPPGAVTDAEVIDSRPTGVHVRLVNGCVGFVERNPKNTAALTETVGETVRVRVRDVRPYSRTLLLAVAMDEENSFKLAA